MAMSLLERLLPAMEAGGRIGSVIEILVLQALAYEAQGNVRLVCAPLSDGSRESTAFQLWP